MSLKKKLTYQTIYKALENKKEILKKYDCIVGISRDWIIPATMLSYILHKPLFIANVDRIKKKVKINWKPYWNILIVDDVYRTWWTINTLKTKIKWDVLVLITDYPSKVDYRIFEEDFYYICEWEKEDESEKFNIGYDLDWVLCRDLRKWERRLTRFPKLMLWYKSRFKLLYRPVEDSIIITWRPESDREATINWLRKNWVYNRIEFCKGEFSIENSIKTKERGIRKFNLKKFYESSSYQAEKLQDCSERCLVLILNNNDKWKR